MDDDIATDSGTVDECIWSVANTGVYSFMLFDLVNDPYETTNLYDTNDDDIAAAKVFCIIFQYLEIEIHFVLWHFVLS